ncbi:SatD family protein [Phenylobacterium sp. LjRoot225]|uniref:SatD family protein n=1 Tax=Phenylobacterium sp. LjRoot225 TaxID=3342285 RepID=UPI003ECFACF6
MTPTRHRDYTHAVVMGDLIRSEAAPSVERLHSLFNRVIDEMNAAKVAEIASPLTITLGDEFQGLCRSLAGGLEIIKALRLTLLAEKVECRFALGVIRLETPLRQDRAWNMMGAGLAATREKLADKRGPNAYRFHLPEEPVLQALLEAIGYSVTLVELDWTERQREIAIASLSGESSAPQLADRLGLGVRTLYKIRSSARLDFYQSQWRSLGAAVQALDLSYGLSDD